MNNYYVYILASKRNGTLYVGATNDLKRRIYEHKNGLIEGFTKKYKVRHPAHFERTNEINSALRREKQIKTWKRKWKLDLIEAANRNWDDLWNML